MQWSLLTVNKRLKVLLFSSVIRILNYLGSLRPGARRSVGRILGDIIYLSAPRRRLIVQRNLQACFGQDFSAERTRLIRQCFRDFGIGILETSRAWFAPKSDIMREVTITGSDPVIRAKESGSGVLLLCPHYTMLELSAPFIEGSLGQFVASYRPHEIEELESIIQSGRSRYSELLNVRSIRGLLRILEEGKVLWFGPDQDMGTKGSVFAPFFGQQASTVTTPSWLAKRSNCAVFFLEMSRDSSGYQVRFKPMPRGYPFEDEVRNATILNQMIEDSLNQQPTQYMWMHQRFKTQPNLPRYSLYK